MVALVIDTSRAMRTHDQLISLANAVRAAKPEDESRSIEWKSGYPDVTAAPASFAIARAILGLANRPVDVAQADFEGVGYVLIGVEPTNLAGQPTPDSANLLNGIRRYTGHGSPLWDPRTITVAGIDILIVTVEAPRPGDRIALLHKSYQPPKGALVEEGTVFVRQPGATERASRADLEMLQDRLLKGTEIDAAAARAADREDKVRTLIADAVHAAQRWTSIMETIVIMSGRHDWSFSSLADITNGKLGEEFGTHALTISQNARMLRLLVKDRNLVEPITAAADLMHHGADAFNGIYGPAPSTSASRAIAYAHLNDVRSAFNTVETTAIAVLN